MTKTQRLATMPPPFFFWERAYRNNDSNSLHVYPASDGKVKATVHVGRMDLTATLTPDALDSLSGRCKEMAKWLRSCEGPSREV